ncbi:thymidylate kinase [Methanobacterium formicicum]|uniref:dTMP kinase n=1 Tax=Methanobacterium formicicum (strain DSM 3637 / PP1) TaxID=1204725 RepID=K2R0F0_METFP|nr:thymidylate kinase [Methanobacterium formicicum]EKF84657.1 thymidylate kinase [Methanobacterium formicicum DSM 3637]
MRFIIIDGLDGSGKSTQARLIQDKYLSKGESVILREHPSLDNSYGQKAKKALLGRGKINKIKASTYYAMDVIRSVKKYDGKADNVIMVRYLMGVAYLPLPLARLLYWFFTLILPTSGYMFFLDLEPDESLQRMSTRNDEEMFENRDDLIKVRKKALQLAHNWHIINTAGSIEEVKEDIHTILDDLDKKY